jgi:putative membrane protein
MNKKLNNFLVLIFYLIWIIFYFKLIILNEIRYYINPALKIFSWGTFIFFIILFLALFIAVLYYKEGKLSFKKSYLIYFLLFIIVIPFKPTTLSVYTKKRKANLMNFSKTPPRNTNIFNKIHRIYKDSDKECNDEIKIDFKLASKKDFYSFINKIHKAFYESDDENIQNQYIGKIYEIKGMYYESKYLCLKNQAILGRIIVTCCMADSIIGGYYIEFPKNVFLKNGEWIQILGKLEVSETKKGTNLILKVLKYEKTDEEDPYIYPNLLE